MAWTIWIPILLFTVLGLAGAVRGWVVPWRSERIFRPRVLGVGTLCLAAAWASSHYLKHAAGIGFCRWLRFPSSLDSC